MLTQNELSNSTPDIASEPLASSFRDPDGYVFREGGVFYRRMSPSYQSAYRHLMDSGLYDTLVKAGHLVSHEEVSGDTLRPEQLSFISYPYEWSFSQWKDAATVTLQIQNTALAHGMSLKDASAFNIQFVRGKPMLIDTFSFEMYREGEPWIGYRQFCEHFLAPLALMSYNDIRLGGLLQLNLDGVPLELATNLLPWKARLNVTLFAHLYVQADFQKRGVRSASATSSKEAPAQGMSRVAMVALLDNLKTAIEGFRWEPKGTVWGEYYADTNYSPDAMTSKEKLVSAYLDELPDPESLWDFGANDARFSRMGSNRGIPTIAFDLDPAAVEKAYRDVRKGNETHLLPLRLDLMNPSPNVGWALNERMSVISRGPADAGMALALIHHIAIGNNVPLTKIADFFKSATRRWLIIEFVPKEDSQTQRLLQDRRDIFDDYHQEGFEAAFTRYGKMVRRENIPDTKRTLYLYRRDDT